MLKVRNFRVKSVSEGGAGNATSDKENPWKDNALYLLVFGIVIVFWILGYWWPVWLDGHPDDIGKRGDMFGAVNALFSGLAFGLLFVALRLQSKELALQREELKEARAVAEQGIYEQKLSNSNAQRNIITQEREMYISTLNNLLVYYTETQRYYKEQFKLSVDPSVLKVIEENANNALLVRKKLEAALRDIGKEI